MIAQRPILDLDWEVPAQIFDGVPQKRGDVAMSIAIAVKNEAQRLVRQFTPDLEQHLPFSQNFQFQVHHGGDNWFALRLVFVPGLSLMVGPRMDGADQVILDERVAKVVSWTPEAFHSTLGSEWFGPDRFTYVGPCDGNRVSWSDISTHLLAWLNSIVLPTALHMNALRVQRAVGKAPSYDIARLSQSLWVLECEQTVKQGTAFALEGVGLVTCEHVLGTASCAFRYNQPERKYPIRIVARHPFVDLAIFEINADISARLVQGDPTIMAHLDNLVVLGHPNYRVGDSPVVSPGFVVGFRPRSGIRRMLTNAAIIAGCSGGPALDQDSRVVGVAITGADAFSAVRETEDISIVPIDALSLIR